jgi:hypothetical protein
MNRDPREISPSGLPYSFFGYKYDWNALQDSLDVSDSFIDAWSSSIARETFIDFLLASCEVHAERGFIGYGGMGFGSELRQMPVLSESLAVAHKATWKHHEDKDAPTIFLLLLRHPKAQKTIMSLSSNEAAAMLARSLTAPALSWGVLRQAADEGVDTDLITSMLNT